MVLKNWLGKLVCPAALLGLNLVYFTHDWQNLYRTLWRVSPKPQLTYTALALLTETHAADTYHQDNLYSLDNEHNLFNFANWGKG